MHRERDILILKTLQEQTTSENEKINPVQALIFSRHRAI